MFGMISILFIEFGKSGYGGSFNSLYQTICNLDPNRYRSYVVFLNQTPFYEKLTRKGIQCFYIHDLILSSGRKKRKYLLGKISGFLLKFFPMTTVLYEYIIHYFTIREIVQLVKKYNIQLIHLNNQLVYQELLEEVIFLYVWQ